MAQPITIKKKTLTVKTMAAGQSLGEASQAQGAAPVEAPVAAPVEAVAAAPVAKAKAARKGIPFLVSTIGAAISIICFIVVVVFQWMSYKDLGRLCYDQPGTGVGSSAAPKSEAAPAAAPEAPAPAAEPKKEEQPAATGAAPAPAAPAAVSDAPPAAAAPDAGSTPKPPSKPKPPSDVPEGV